MPYIRVTVRTNSHQFLGYLSSDKGQKWWQHTSPDAFFENKGLVVTLRLYKDLHEFLPNGNGKIELRIPAWLAPFKPDTAVLDYYSSGEHERYPILTLSMDYERNLFVIYAREDGY